jgi:predicted secreted hydrolase
MKKTGIILLAMAFFGMHAIVADSSSRTAEGFLIPTVNPVFDFPRDHGSHPGYRIEWWYITGHLCDDVAHRYGFQATFFRYAMVSNTSTAIEAFGTNQLYMAHMALTDVKQQKFYHEERLNRDGWDASARTEDLDLKNGNWSLCRTEGETMELQASIQSDIQLQLTLEPTQSKVVFGKDGLSRKGADPSACSWYITFPRLKVSGVLGRNEDTLAVSGEAWMDHEISSSQLGHEQVGWDWLSARLNDGSEIMVYILRDTEGRPDPFSTLAWIDIDGRVHHVGPDRFSWSSDGSWTSPETGAVYPIDVTLRGQRPDGEPFEFKVKPLLRGQELVGQLGGISYWEGACDLVEAGKPIGEAYMELTGYSESLKENLK